jgi:hypothetical protein
MNYRFVPASALIAAGLVACSDASSPSRATAPDPELRLGKAVTPSNPTATVKVPLAADAFSVRSDGKYSDGTYSVYADGVCGITGTIFLTGSGDAVVDGGNPRYADKKCVNYPRKMSVFYPDGSSEVISGVEVAVQELETSSYVIPVGSAALRHFHVRTSTTRCDGVHWGTFGGDSAMVTRTTTNTWHVQTQPYPNDQAACKNSAGNYVLGHMPLDLWVVSSRALP